GDGGPATNAALNNPQGVAVDAAGNLYIADYFNFRIRKVNSSGIITTLAGSGSYRFAGDGGPATTAPLYQPRAVAVDAADNLYIAETLSNRVRKITPGGIISTVAGNGLMQFSGDGGPATAAALLWPQGVAVDAAGNVYVADLGPRRVRKIGSDGVITTVAGGGSANPGDGGPATSASLSDFSGIAVDAAGNLYIAGNSNNRIRKVSPSGIITTAAGKGPPPGFSGDGGLATSASLYSPTGVAVDTAGNLYIADKGNNRIRKVSPGGIITTVAGDGVARFSGDGGQAANASLYGPLRVALDTAGNLYIADGGNGRVRKIDPGGIITTVAGGGLSLGLSGVSATSTRIIPEDVGVDSRGNLYIVDWGNRIRKVLAASPAFAAVPASLSFSTAAGAPAVTPQLVAVTSAVTGLGWTASASAPWLGISPSAGAVPALISVGVNAKSLSPGTYNGTVTVTAPLAADPVQIVAVELTVLPPSDARPELDSSSIVLETTAAAGNPPAKTLRLGNAGSGTVNWTAEVRTLNGGNWLRLSPMSGASSAQSPVSIQVSANAAGLPAGVYSGLITINSPSSPEPRTVPVDLIVTQATQTLSLTQSALRFTTVEGEPASAQKIGIVNTGQGVMNWTARVQTVNGGSWLTVSPASGQSEAGSVIVSQAEAAANTRGLRAGTYAGFIRVDAPAANDSPRLVTVVLTVLAAGSKTGTRLSPSGLIFTARDLYGAGRRRVAQFATGQSDDQQSGAGVGCWPTVHAQRWRLAEGAADQSHGIGQRSAQHRGATGCQQAQPRRVPGISDVHVR
ncbi:MAG: SBBP repeat-containing protein, partial [Acidobacteria bacterium]|nr:SBBP repeat-containing protein [Acidobacteriota bacterium]